MDKGTSRALEDLSRRLDALAQEGHHGANGNGGGLSASMLSKALSAAEEAKAQATLAVQAATAAQADCQTLLEAMATLEQAVEAKGHVVRPAPAPEPSKTLVLPAHQAEAAATKLYRQMSEQLETMIQNKVDARVDHVLNPQLLDLATQMHAKLKDVEDTLDRRVGSQMAKRTQEIVRDAASGPLDNLVGAKVSVMLVDHLEEMASAVLSVLVEMLGIIKSTDRVMVATASVEPVTLKDLAQLSIHLRETLAAKGLALATKSGNKELASQLKQAVRRGLSSNEKETIKEFVQQAKAAIPDLAKQAPSDQPILPTDIAARALSKAETAVGEVVSGREGFEHYMAGADPTGHKQAVAEAGFVPDKAPPAYQPNRPHGPTSGRYAGQRLTGGLGAAAGFQIILDEPKCKVTARPGINIVGRYREPANGRARSNWRVWHIAGSPPEAKAKLPELERMGLELFCLKVENSGSYWKIEV